MFNLEINFLKDRQLDTDTKSPIGTKGEFQLGEYVPLFLGIGVMVLCLGGTYGFSWYIGGQAEQSQKNIDQLDQQLSAFKGDKAQLETVQKDLARIKDETKAIVNVFSTVQSVSAILQDLSDQTPRGVSVLSVEEVDGPATPESGGLPVTKLNLSGIATDYDVINDFLLTLQKSPFINQAKTQLNEAESVDSTFEFISPKNLPRGVSWQYQNNMLTVKTPKEIFTVKIPEKNVKYTISTELNNISAEKNLIQMLQEKGSSGLVTRLKTLKEKGLIQP